MIPQHSSSYSDHEEEEEESEPSSPKSPSPKISPGSKSPSPHSSLENKQPSQKICLSTSSEHEEVEISDELSWIRETDQELLDEMIVKEDPILFQEPVEDSKNRVEEIGTIAEDEQDDSSHSECKDVDLKNKQLADPFSYPLPLVPNNSFPYFSESDPNEMPSKQQDEDEADRQSPFKSGFVATDSKDSLEVQAHSVVEDFSETMSGREESLDDIKQQQVASSDESEEDYERKENAVADFEVIQESEVQEARNVKEETEIFVSSQMEKKVSYSSSSQMKNVMEIFEQIENESVSKTEAQKQEEFVLPHGEALEGQDMSSEAIEGKEGFKSNVSKDQGLSLGGDTGMKEAAFTNVFEREEKCETVETKFKAVTSKIEKLVETQDEVIATTAYITTGGSYVDSEPLVLMPGTLRVNIIQASGLVNQDYVGLSDPYVTVNFKSQVHRSQTVNESLEPIWNFAVDLEIFDAESDIVVEVFDDDYGRDNFEGGLNLTVSELLKHTNHEPIWYNLTGCKAGKILISSSYSTSTLSVPDIHESEVAEKKKHRRESNASSSSTSSEEANNQGKFVAEASTDSSVSTKQESTIKKFNTQDTVEENESLALDAQKEKKVTSITSSDSSDTEDEKKEANLSSSDYDSSVNVQRKGKRPESFVSDTSSDYDSLSDVGKRRPQSFVLDDEYEVITEEETNESETKITADRRSTSSSYESEDPAEAEKKIMTAVQVTTQSLLTTSSATFKKLEGDDNEKVVADPDGISSHPDPFPSSLSSTLDLHAQQSSNSVDKAHSTVNSSNTLEGIDPLANDAERVTVSPSHILPGLDSSNPLDPQGTG